jgi:hypothetical protein
LNIDIKAKRRFYGRILSSSTPKYTLLKVEDCHSHFSFYFLLEIPIAIGIVMTAAYIKKGHAEFFSMAFE